MRVLDMNRPAIGGVSVGLTRRTRAAIKYAKERKQFGKAIAEFQGAAVHARRHGDEPAGLSKQIGNLLFELLDRLALIKRCLVGFFIHDLGFTIT
ncbi:acyl-CoA dehydrogenase family protein [Bradyrhizobium genosp. P]|uniref:acyl-CoA dehydrogenase family protein n=1 Tax=Bradyrhizobium genosp. P TaxID=83641 RepID=UPI003CF91235